MFWTNKRLQHGLSYQHKCVYSGVGGSLEEYTSPYTDTSLAIAVHVVDALLKKVTHLAKTFSLLSTAYGTAVGVGILAKEFQRLYCSSIYFVKNTLTCNLKLQRTSTQIRIEIYWVSTPTEHRGVILFPNVCMALLLLFYAVTAGAVTTRMTRIIVN